MISSKYLWVLVLTLAACSQGHQSNYSEGTLQKDKLQDTSHSAGLYYPWVIKDLNKKITTEAGNYYMLTRFSDSAVRIAWGNDIIKRVYDASLDLMFAERLSVKWENKDYLILGYNTGSGTWLNVVMPLNNKEQVREFNNGLYFDKKYNLFVTEEFADTVLAVRNLKTRATQFVIEKQRPCDASLNSSCLDKVSISNKVLYYEWTTPHKFDEKKNSIKKRIYVTI